MRSKSRPDWLLSDTARWSQQTEIVAIARSVAPTSYRALILGAVCSTGHGKPQSMRPSSDVIVGLVPKPATIRDWQAIDRSSLTGTESVGPYCLSSKSVRVGYPRNARSSHVGLLL
jgi:hypothetical protein